MPPPVALKATLIPIPPESVLANPEHNSAKWDGITSHSNGNLYCAPCYSNEILVIDVDTNTCSTFSAEINTEVMYLGIVEHSNGKLYCPPHTVGGEVLVVDPVSQSCSTIPCELGSWSGIVNHIDGKMYCAPSDSNGVLVIDPTTNICDIIPCSISRGDGNSSYWSHLVSHSDGKLYCAPLNSPDVLVIDSATKSCSTIPCGFTGQWKWIGIASHSDGKLYCAPLDSPDVLVIDPATQSCSAFPCGIDGSWKWQGIVSLNGKLYCSPYHASQILVIDPATETCSGIRTGMKGESKWNGIVLHSDGQLYCSPSSTSAVLAIKGFPMVKGDIRSKSSALNDNALGIDRLGYRLYAIALVKMLSVAFTPISVGLYAPWGSGKSFMISLLKKLLDPTARENKLTFELVQHFEDGYEALPIAISDQKKEKDEEEVVTEKSSCIQRWVYRFYLILPSRTSIWNSLPYWVLTWFTILASSTTVWRSFMYEVVRGRKALKGEDEEIVELGADLEGQSSSTDSRPPKEYVFVDYNAWLFAGGEGALWAGLVRTLYAQAEQRILKQTIDEQGRDTNFLVEWRLEKSMRELEKKYGGRKNVQRLATMLLMSVLCLLLLVVCEAIGITHIFESVKSSFLAASSVIVALILVCASAIGPFRMLLHGGQESDVSRGDVVFEKSSSLKDQLGFMDFVKKELQDLFAFIKRVEPRIGKELVFVIFIDDLDRCLNGKNVKVLEAVTLMLSVPGAPIIAFLAIDSRIVVASIDHVFSQSMELDKTNVSGQEYMDKVVQVPFALPTPSVDKVKRLIQKSLEGNSATTFEVKKRLEAIFKAVKKMEMETGKSIVLSFPEVDEEAVVDIDDEAEDDADGTTKEDDTGDSDEDEDDEEEDDDEDDKSSLYYLESLKSMYLSLKTGKLPADNTKAHIEEFLKDLLSKNKDTLSPLDLRMQIVSLMQVICLSFNMENNEDFDISFVEEDQYLEFFSQSAEDQQLIVSILEQYPQFLQQKKMEKSMNKLLENSNDENNVSYVEAKDFYDVFKTKSSTPTSFVKKAADLLSQSTKKSVQLSEVLGEEGIEIMCRAVNDALDGMQCFTVSKLIGDSVANEKSSTVATKDEKDKSIASQNKVGEGEATQASGTGSSIPTSELNLREVTTSRHKFQLDKQQVRLSVEFTMAEQLIPPECINVFVHLRSVIDVNPRRVKRILNVFQVAYNLAEVWPLKESDPLGKKVKDHENWPAFASKLIKWICLCEMFPYRISFLVQVVEDYNQKANVNKIVQKQAGVGEYFQYFNSEEPMKDTKKLQSSKQGPLSSIVKPTTEQADNFSNGRRDASSKGSDKFGKDDKVPSVNLKNQKLTERLAEDKSIAVIFAEYVERQLYFDGCEYLSILDSDPELFWQLISIDVPTCDRTGNMVTTKVADIFGPKGNRLFSLLHYSVNLNPALRQQISASNAGFVSQSELKRQNESGKIDSALAANSVIQKKRVVRDVSPGNRARRTSYTSSQYSGSADSSSHRRPSFLQENAQPFQSRNLRRMTKLDQGLPLLSEEASLSGLDTDTASTVNQGGADGGRSDGSRSKLRSRMKDKERANLDTATNFGSSI